MQRNRTAQSASLIRLICFTAGIVGGIGFGLSSARADLLYATNFESPTFVAGQTIAGQGGFTVPGGSNPNSLLVTTSLPHSGTQDLEAFGSQLTGSPGFVLATAGVTLNYNAAHSIVTLDAFARLDGPSTDKGQGTSDDLVSINLEAILGDGSYFSTYLSSNGQAYAFTTNYDFSAPAALGQYHDLNLALNFADRTSTFTVDGQALGTLPFDPSVTSNVLSSAQFTMYAVSSVVNPADYTAHADDFQVSASAVPEPATLTMLGFGVAGLLGYGWRKRKHVPVVTA